MAPSSNPKATRVPDAQHDAHLGGGQGAPPADFFVISVPDELEYDWTFSLAGAWADSDTNGLTTRFRDLEEFCRLPEEVREIHKVC